MPVTKVKIGDLDNEYGTVTADGTGFEFEGSNTDALKAHVRHWAQVVGRDARNDEALKRIKPEKILQAMVDADQGAVWTIEVDEGDDWAGDGSQTRSDEVIEDDDTGTEDSPAPTANVDEEWVLDEGGS